MTPKLTKETSTLSRRLDIINFMVDKWLILDISRVWQSGIRNKNIPHFSWMILPTIVIHIFDLWNKLYIYIYSYIPIKPQIKRTSYNHKIVHTLVLHTQFMGRRVNKPLELNNDVINIW